MTTDMDQASRDPAIAKNDEPRRFRRWLAIIVAALLLGLLAWFLTASIIQRTFAARIPPLADLSEEPAPVAEQLHAAHREALDDPTSGHAVGALAMALHANTFSRAALPCYEIAAALDRDDPRWIWGRILLLEEFGEADRAFELLQAFMADDRRHGGNYVLAWFKLGEAQLNRGDWKAAGQAFQKLASIKSPYRAPDREPIHPVPMYGVLGLAKIAFQQRRFDEVETLMQTVLPELSSFGPGHRLLGRAYQELGRDADAQRELALAEKYPPYAPPTDPMLDDLALMSRSTTFLLRAASLARSAGDAKWAERLLRQALRFYPDDLDVTGELTLLLATDRRLDEAAALLDKYLALKPPHPGVVIKIGTQFSTQADHERAMRCFRYAIALDPGNATAHRNLGAALAVTRQFADAEQSFRKALELDPQSYMGQYNLARVLFESGQHDKVAEHCRAALRINPEFTPAKQLLAAVGE
jgi:tetratricopeptide (TPR) repeat protein